jgi:hypothetical protein
MVQQLSFAHILMHAFYSFLQACQPNDDLSLLTLTQRLLAGEQLKIETPVMNLSSAKSQEVSSADDFVHKHKCHAHYK